MEIIVLILTLCAGLAGGYLFAEWRSNRQKPAYLVVSTAVVNNEALEVYREQAGPLAEAAGLEMLASGKAELLEGDWPHHPTITVERFRSMDALKSFWHSEQYQSVKPLRDGHLDVAFIVAVDGLHPR